MMLLFFTPIRGPSLTNAREFSLAGGKLMKEPNRMVFVTCVECSMKNEKKKRLKTNETRNKERICDLNARISFLVAIHRRANTSG